MPSMQFARLDLNQTLHRWLLYLIPLTFMMVTPWSLSEVALWAGYGKHLVSDLSFLYTDTASILPTDNNVTSSWALSLLYYGLYKVGGFFAVAHFHHVILVCILGLLYRSTIFMNPWPWTLRERLPIYLVWLGAGAAFSLRPALVAFVPFLLTYQLLEKRASQHEPLRATDWLRLTLLQILWVNLHGSFVLLPLMTGWVCLSQRAHWKKSLAGLILTTSSILINPFGWHIFPYILRTREYSRLLGISEWASAFSLNYPLQFLCYWGLLAGLVVLALKNSRSGVRSFLPSPLVPLLLVPLGGLRLSVFALFALPLFLHYYLGIYSLRMKRIEKQPSGGLFALALIVAATIGFSPYFKKFTRVYLPPHLQASFDEATITKISDRIQGWPDRNCPILNDFNVGHFLLLKADNPYLLDGRATPFTGKSLEIYQSIMSSGKDSDLWLRKERPCLAILSPDQSPELIEKLKTEYHFTPLMAENGYILMANSENLRNDDIHNK